jgi:hypothetical protein
VRARRASSSILLLIVERCSARTNPGAPAAVVRSRSSEGGAPQDRSRATGRNATCSNAGAAGAGSEIGHSNGRIVVHLRFVPYEHSLKHAEDLRRSAPTANDVHNLASVVLITSCHNAAGEGEACVLSTRSNGGKKSQISKVKFRHGATLRESLTPSYKKRPVASHPLQENPNDHGRNSSPRTPPLSAWSDGPPQVGGARTSTSAVPISTSLGCYLLGRCILCIAGSA